MFKKHNPHKISGKWNYYPIRDVSKDPVTEEDTAFYIATESRESGSEFYQKHLRIVNTLFDRAMVENCLNLMSSEASHISKTHSYFPSSELTENEVRIFLAHGYFLAATEDGFGIAIRGKISGACRDAMMAFARSSVMENPKSGEVVLHCLYRGYEIARSRVPLDDL